MPLILGTNSIKDTGYNVDNSLRFDQASSDNLTRTTSGGSYRKMTFSCWSKKSDLDEMCLLGFTNGSSNPQFAIKWDANNEITVMQYTGSYDLRLVSTPRYRDVSAWYHVVVAIDTEQATSSNRVKIYINGSQVTDFDIETYPSQNSDLKINGNVSTCSISDLYSGYGYQEYGGYLAEVCYIDGQQLAPDQFGEFDEDTGIWKPIDVSGLTFGTNGFYLDFENSGSLGADVSGNGNNFTVNNLTSIDQTTDTPTNNFTTWNPLVPISNISFSEGNLKASTSATSKGAKTTIASSTGKWYFENKLGSSAGNVVTGIAQDISNFTYVGSDLYSYGHFAGNIYNNGSTNTYTGTASNNDIVSIGLDLNNNKMYVAINGTWLNSANPSSGTGGFTITSGNYHFAVSGDTSQSWEGNFGNPPFTISSGNTDGNGYGNFEYAVPSGYYALNTKNLAEYG